MSWTKQEKASIILECWKKSLDRALRMEVAGSPVGMPVYFLAELLVRIYPENNAWQDLLDNKYVEHYAIAGASNMALLLEDFNAFGFDFIEDPDPDSLKIGDMPLYNRTDPDHIGRHTTYPAIYLGGEMFPSSMWGIIRIEDYDFPPHLVANIYPNFKGEGELINGKYCRPHGPEDKSLWDEFWGDL